MLFATILGSRKVRKSVRLFELRPDRFSLSGIAHEFGDPDRGARYNSALRCVHSQRTACMAFIVSEDGGVDVVPELRPRISRRIIDDALWELEDIEQCDPVPRQQFPLVLVGSFYLP